MAASVAVARRNLQNVLVGVFSFPELNLFSGARSESVRRLDIAVFSRESGRPDRKPSEIPIMRPLIIPIMVEVCSFNFYFSVLDISVFVGKAGGRIESQTKSR